MKITPRWCFQILPYFIVVAITKKLMEREVELHLKEKVKDDD